MATFGSKGIQMMKRDEERSNYIKGISALLGLISCFGWYSFLKVSVYFGS